MNLHETLLKPRCGPGSGSVRRFDLADQDIRVTQITTFCPDIVGPGPAHVYLIEADAVVLLDTGMPTGLAKAFFYYWRNQPIPTDIEQLPENYAELELLDALRIVGRDMSEIDLVIISHGHPDHFLMARSILRSTDATVSAHILDTPQICNCWGLLSGWYGRVQLMKASGMPSAWSARDSVREEMIQRLDLDAMGLALKVDNPFFGNATVKAKAAQVPGLEVIHLPGHTPGSIGIMVGKGQEKVLLCGDVLLNPITPHPDDLLTYMRTLNELRKHKEVVLTLPAHGEEIRDLPGRAASLLDHHKRRLELTHQLCQSPRCVWDVATSEGYFETYVDPRKFNLLAGIETLVHMEVLHMVDGLRRTHIKDGVHYFQAAAEPFGTVYERILELVLSTNPGPLMRY